MSGVIVEAVKAVAGPVKTLVIDKITNYVKFINSYDDNMECLMDQLEILCAKKLDIDAKVLKGKQNLEVMTRETANWRNSLIKLIEREETKKLMKEERVAEIVVKMLERRVLKKLWDNDREIFDIVVRVVKKKCNQGSVDEEDEEEDADYKKVAKIAKDVMRDIAEEFKKFVKRDDTAVAVVKLLNSDDLEKLRKDGEEMAMILSKAEGIIRKEAEHSDHGEGEEELLLPEHDEDVQPVNESFIKEKVASCRKRIGSLMAFLDDENFKKGLPNGAILGLEVMDALTKSTGSEQAQASSKSHRYCGWCVVRYQVYCHRHDMSVMALTMVKAIKSLVHECIPGPVTRNVRDDELEIIPGEFIEGLESREAVLRKILVALKDGQINFVGVYGMGGCGKTTLAKEVAYKRASDLFDKRVVVDVSDVPNIKGIQNQIAVGIGLTLNDMHTVAQRARILYNKLKSEKILIILDNVWKKLKLDEVGIPNESTKDFYCKILITTREKQVCRFMDVQEANIFKVGLLNEREALNLFENQTEEKVGSGEFKPVADRLLRKCGGLPLAIATTASALRGKNLAMWCHFADTSEKPISCQVSSEYRETYSILETSYKLIEIEEKKIFLSLACLSPQDSAVRVDDLMRYGIGLDLFQHFNGLSEAIEQANVWANELISSSLLSKGAFDGEVKIHDLVRASAISFIDKGKDRMTLVESIPRWMCEETFEKFTAISLMSGHDFSRLSGVNAPMLEILLLKGDVSSTTLPFDFFAEMKNLKVLSLSNMNFSLGLPESMEQLERLKTLHLHHCKLRDVKLIGKLVNLLVLSLRGSTLEELAIEIGELCKLRLLDMGGCKGVKSIPANILPRLSHLEGLYMFNGFRGWASTNIDGDIGRGRNQASGSELDTLSHLNVLEMEVPKAEHVLTIKNSQLVEQLGKFRIRVGNSFGQDSAELSAFRNILELENIDPSQNDCLSALLKKTNCLLVTKCRSFAESFVPFFDGDGFSNLRYLEVTECKFKFLVSSNEHDETTTFVNLELLRLRNINNLEMICDGKAPAGMFSNLRRLELLYLPNLKCGLPLTLVPLNLSEVVVESCPSLKFIVSKDASVAENETDTVLFPLLKSLDLARVQSLTNVLGQSHTEIHTIECSSVDRHFFDAKSIYPSLETLMLNGNRTIVSLWSKACDVSNFQNLKILRISYCRELQSMGSPSIFAALVQLEEFSIKNCDKLQEVIIKEREGHKVRKHVINFPVLKHLCLGSLPKLERFYGGGFKLEFPNLKSLNLSDAPNLTNFDGSENSTTFFSNKIEFPCLEELEVQSVSNEVVRLWNWSSLNAPGENDESGSISLNPVPNLQKLTLGEIDGLKSIPHSITRKLSHLRVTNFHVIKELFSVSAVDIEVFWTYSKLLNLENLSVCGCDSLEQLIDNEGDVAALVLCERLIGITLDNMPKLKILPLHLLKNICTLSLKDLRWKYVFSAELFVKGKEQLQQLENLEISQCEDMEVIIMDEQVGDGEARVYNFPRLKRVMLKHLNITSFSSKPGTMLQFLSLEKVDMANCHKIQSFCSGPLTAPKLKVVELWDCNNLQFFVSGEMNRVREMPSLERVDIWKCCNLLSFSSEPLAAPKLQDVVLDTCPKMTWFLRGIPSLDDIVELPSLGSVKIAECTNMESFSSGGIKAPNLCELEVNEQGYSKCANEELQDMLLKLITRVALSRKELQFM